jgi:hypothetical protein
MLNVVMLLVFMLSAMMLGAVMLNVKAPERQIHSVSCFCCSHCFSSWCDQAISVPQYLLNENVFFSTCGLKKFHFLNLQKILNSGCTPVVVDHIILDS